MWVLLEEWQVLPPKASMSSFGNCQGKRRWESQKKILAIIQREKDRSFWWRLNYALGKKKGGGYFKVQMKREGGLVEEFTEQDQLHEALWNNIHCKHFYPAEEAPLCSGPLRGDFGYDVLTPTLSWSLTAHINFPQILMQLLERSYKNAQESGWRCLETQYQQRSLQRTGWTIGSQNKKKLNPLYWGGNFECYQAGLPSPYATYLHALSVTLIVKRGIVLVHWLQDLSWMLEKYAVALWLPNFTWYY